MRPGEATTGHELQMWRVNAPVLVQAHIENGSRQQATATFSASWFGLD